MIVCLYYVKIDKKFEYFLSKIKINDNPHLENVLKILSSSNSNCNPPSSQEISPQNVQNNFQNFQNVQNVQNVQNTSQKRISKGEQITKDALESIFNKPFISVRPDWLRNPKTNRCLEIDCFNEELMLCVEYHGEQHYKFPNRYHLNETEFKEQVYRDVWKKETLKNMGYSVIIVPYDVPYDDIYNYILERVKKMYE